MKIALIGPAPPPNGGMAMQTRQLQQLLTNAGHQVSLIVTNAQYRPQIIGRIPMLRALFRLLPYLWHLIKELKHYQVIHLMANSGWSFYLFVMPVVYIAAFYKVPVIMNYRGGEAERFFARSWPLIQGAMQRVNKVIVPSGFLQAIFKKYDIEVQVVPNIIDLSVFDFVKPSFHSKALHLVITRNLEAIYDNATAIKAFANFVTKYPLSHLTIAGTGIEEIALKNLA